MDCVANSRLQDDDVALANLLQEQERALYLLGHASSAYREVEEDLTDEQLARRLQEEEDEAAYEMAYAQTGMANVTAKAEVVHEEGAADEHDQSAMPFSYEDMLALGDLAGKVSKGLKAEALGRLPIMRVCTLRTLQGEPGVVSLDRCCICQLDFEDDDEATPLPCRHCYHTECAMKWLQQSKACPVCGAELEIA